jgi:electron transfer flavoprotein alpha subunit
VSAGTVYCLIETDGEEVTDASRRALTLARELGPVTAVLVGGAGTPAPVTDLAAYGATEACQVMLDGYAPRAWARALAGLAAPGSAVVAAGTDHGNEVLAHLGAITGLSVAVNCVAAVRPPDGSGWAVTRQRWAGLLLEDALLDQPVALLTVAADAVAAVPLAGDATGAELRVRAVSPQVTEADLAVRAAEERAQAGGASLASARVVVGGGRGVGSADGFAPLEELAGLLGGVVGVSRVVTSEGWRPHAQQVGQTGTKITPDLYLACGISGAIQHIAGCAGARHIIAVNTDPAAPMMSRAEYAVVGDLHEVIPALIAAIRAG